MSDILAHKRHKIWVCDDCGEESEVACICPNGRKSHPVWVVEVFPPAPPEGAVDLLREAQQLVWHVDLSTDEQAEFSQRVDALLGPSTNRGQ